MPLLLIMLIAIGPCELVASTFLDQTSAEMVNPEIVQTAAWTGIKITVWGLVFLQIAIMIATASFLIVNRTWPTVKYAIAAIWIVGPLWNVISVWIVNAA